MTNSSRSPAKICASFSAAIIATASLSATPSFPAATSPTASKSIAQPPILNIRLFPPFHEQRRFTRQLGLSGLPVRPRRPQISRRVSDGPPRSGRELVCSLLHRSICHPSFASQAIGRGLPKNLDPGRLTPRRHQPQRPSQTARAPRYSRRTCHALSKPVDSRRRPAPRSKRRRRPPPHSLVPALRHVQLRNRRRARQTSRLPHLTANAHPGSAPLLRRPRLHQRARRQRAGLPQPGLRPPSVQFPRPARTPPSQLPSLRLSLPDRPNLLRKSESSARHLLPRSMLQNRRGFRAKGPHSERKIFYRLPIPARTRPMAQALHRSRTPQTPRQRRQKTFRDLPRLCCRLPRDPRRNRHSRPRILCRCRRKRIRPHSLPQRASPLARHPRKNDPRFHQPRSAKTPPRSRPRRLTSPTSPTGPTLTSLPSFLLLAACPLAASLSSP